MTCTLSEFTELAGRVHAFIADAGVGASGELGGDAMPTAVGAAQGAGFNALALELFALQTRHNPALRVWLGARGRASGQVRNWREIPALPVSAFKELEVTALPAEARTTVFHSSGTTGDMPSRHFHSAESLRLYEASLRPWFWRHLWPEGAGGREAVGLRQIILTPPPAQVPHSSLVHMFAMLAGAAGVARFVGRVESGGTWNLNYDAAVGQVRAAAESGAPMMVLGTAFSFVHLLDCFTSRDITVALPAGSRVLETGGYKGRSRRLPKVELHAEITRRLGVPASHIVCEYGMSELSSQAYDTVLPAQAGRARRFHFPPWARAVVVSPETGAEVGEGETGLLRIYDLANVWSVLAVQTEDLGVRRGDGFELLGRAAEAEPRGCSRMTA